MASLIKKTLSDSSSVAELEGRLMTLEQQRTAAQTRVDELTKRRASLLVPALAESDTAAAAQIDAIDPELATETRRIRDLDLVIGHINELLGPARTREQEQQRTAHLAAVKAELDELGPKISAGVDKVIESARKELRPHVVKLQRLAARHRALNEDLKSATGDERPSPVSLETLTIEICEALGLPKPASWAEVRAWREEAHRMEAAGFHAGRAAGMREVREGTGETLFRGNG